MYTREIETLNQAYYTRDVGIKLNIFIVHSTIILHIRFQIYFSFKNLPFSLSITKNSKISLLLNAMADNGLYGFAYYRKKDNL